MLYNLNWLQPGKLFPPEKEKERLQRYRDNEFIFSNDVWGLNDNVYNEAARRITRVIGNFESFISFPVLFNFQKLISLKTADLVAGEFPTITCGSDEGNEAINEARSLTDFDNNLYATVLDLSRFGDAIWRKYKDGDTGKYTYCNWKPSEWFPIVSTDGTYRIDKHCLVWPVIIDEDRREYELHAQIHEKGKYTFKRFKFSTASIKPSQLLEAAGTIGECLETKVVPTGLKDNAVVHLRPYKVTGTVYGDDDFTPINSIITELMVRIAQISNILDKHADPSLTGPASLLEVDEETGELYFKKGKFYAVNEGETKPEYLTWDGQLDSSFKQCEFLINQLYVLCEMGAALLGANDGGSQAVSGNALRLKMVNPLAKVRRISNNLSKPVKELFVTLVSKGYDTAVEFKDLSVKWKDGLPNDPREQTELIKLLTGESTIMPLQNALIQYMNLSPAETKSWIEKIAEAKSKQPEPEDPDAPETGVDGEVSPSASDLDIKSGEGDPKGPGSKTGVNPRKKGSIMEPHQTGTHNTNSSRDRR